MKRQNSYSGCWTNKKLQWWISFHTGPTSVVVILFQRQRLSLGQNKEMEITSCWDVTPCILALAFLRNPLLLCRKVGTENKAFLLSWVYGLRICRWCINHPPPPIDYGFLSCGPRISGVAIRSAVGRWVLKYGCIHVQFLQVSKIWYRCFSKM